MDLQKRAAQLKPCMGQWRSGPGDRAGRKGGPDSRRTSTCTASRSTPQTSRRRYSCSRRSAPIHSGMGEGTDAHHDDLEEEDDKDAREGEAGAEEEHQEEQRRDDDPIDVLRRPEFSISA